MSLLWPKAQHSPLWQLRTSCDRPQEAALKAAEAARPRERTEADEEAELRAAATPMAVSDAIQRMLLAWKDRDYFRRGLSPKRPTGWLTAPLQASCKTGSS